MAESGTENEQEVDCCGSRAKVKEDKPLRCSLYTTEHFEPGVERGGAGHEVHSATRR